jgi:hypothetical protein
MYDADIQSMDAAAKGAKVWPQINTGFVYDAHDVKCGKETKWILEWGLICLDLHKWFQCSKLNADSDYMNAMSS